MSAFNASDIAEMVRRRFALPEGAELQFIPLVGPALRSLAYDVAKDPNLRDWLLTDPATITVTLDGDGVADLSTLITTNKILLECLHLGEILPPVNPNYSTQPFRLISNAGAGQLAGNYDSLVYKAWVEGTSLHTKSPDNNVTPLVGTISFSVPYEPTMAELPESLVQKLVDGPYWQVTPLSEAKNAA